MNVANKKCIRNLSVKNMRASRSRNIISIVAIALTTMLFTSMFTIIMSAIYAYEQSNFRQVGGYSHCGIKGLTAEQADILAGDPMIKSSGKRLFVGMASGEKFAKSGAEISSIDPNYAEMTFVKFTEGGLPAENTRQAAADTHVLALLGVQPKLGEEFTVTMTVGRTEMTETFELCGWWEFDTALPVGNVFLPYSRSNEILRDSGAELGIDSYTGYYSLDMMLRTGSRNIEENVQKIITGNGFQFTSEVEPNYVRYGVNWGYIASQTGSDMDAGTLAAIALLLLVIIFTGYLVIYNVFRISVSNDIRYYGLLKTIGTTGAQIRKMISIQAMRLSLVGIPAGLVIGYGVGALLCPVVLSHMNGISADSLSFSPLIFLCSAVFALGTVILSCRRPAKIAAKISPIEAVRYTESTMKKKTRRSKKGASITKMALANLSRSKGKTLVTIVSLTLSAVLLNLTVTFARGFDMDKYLRKMPADIIAADSGYFQSGTTWEESLSVPSDNCGLISAQDFVSGSGMTYGSDRHITSYVPDSFIRHFAEEFLSGDEVDEYLSRRDKDGDRYDYNARLYGMDDFCLSKLTVISGDISKLDGSGKYIAAVYSEDDYGKPEMASNWAKVGDKVKFTISDSDEFVWVDVENGAVYDKYAAIPEGRKARFKPKESHTAEFEIAAEVIVPYYFSYRYYTESADYLMDSATFIRETGSAPVIYTALDIADGRESEAESFLAGYTENAAPFMNFESKSSLAEDFKSFRNMFLLLGGVMSFIVGIVGILNFINVILTGVIARRKELAVLQSIGMTGAQLKRMLITEGLIYTLSGAAVSLVLFVALAPLMKTGLETIFWFISFRLTVLPIVLLIPVFGLIGVLIPLLTHKAASRRSIVERLREAE